MYWQLDNLPLIPVGSLDLGLNPYTCATNIKVCMAYGLDENEIKWLLSPYFEETKINKYLNNEVKTI